MNVTGNAITNTDRPETSIKESEKLLLSTVSADKITRMSELKQAASSSANTKRVESQAL